MIFLLFLQLLQIGLNSDFHHSLTPKSFTIKKLKKAPGHSVNSPFCLLANLLTLIIVITSQRVG
jgi:hypothetical protein